MKRNLKIILLISSVLGLLVVIQPSARANPTSYGDNVLYVDNDWSASNCPSELAWNENAFARIKDAVDNADSVENNTIVVEPGAYEEDNIVLDVENLTVKSAEDYAVTTLESISENDIFVVTANNVEIEGFTFTGASGRLHEWGSAGIYLDNVENPVIRKNYFINNEAGICLNHSSNGVIKK